MSNGFNATQATIDAKYSNKSAMQKGYRLKKDPEIIEYVDMCMEEKERELQIGKEEVLKLLSEKIRGTAIETHVFVTRSGTKTSFHENLIEKTLPIKQRDILKAVEIYSKIRGWDKEKEEHKPTLNIYNDVPDEEKVK
jgi:phage terminase small subunit